MYGVKEVFYTVQGEGAQAGRAAVFCRFAGCNLWSGLEKDRQSAICKFCDTDFVGTDGENGQKYSAASELAAVIAKTWKGGKAGPVKPMVVITGGEPLLQLDKPLIDAIHAEGFEIAVETNGTLKAPDGIDWLCVSPKANARLVQTSGHELKVVVPQKEFDMAELATLRFQQFFVQPMDGPRYEENCQLAVEFCKSNPRWRISTQMHKHLAIA